MALAAAAIISLNTAQGAKRTGKSGTNGRSKASKSESDPTKGTPAGKASFALSSVKIVAAPLGSTTAASAFFSKSNRVCQTERSVNSIADVVVVSVLKMFG